jgi:hypothetical protein
MKSKIVENWLTKVTELTFTVPFCQMLLSEGKRVVHISSQGPMEQGKDVIAVDDSGTVHCYQLKCGNINARVWAEIKAEIDQLVELPPRHPSLPHEVGEWEAYLVTNGNIANPTARDIYDYAASKKSKGHRPLKTIVGTQLVARFTELYDDFLPVGVVDLQQFLELYNQHGDYELDVKKFKVFFESFFYSHQGDSRQKKVEAIRASLILCNYLLTHKYSRENHLDIIKAYVLLLASIYFFVESHELAETLWKDTERLAYEAIETEFRRFIDELITHERHYVQVEYGVLSEAVTHKIRCSELTGYLAAYRNACALRGTVPYESVRLDEITLELLKTRALLGECFVPFFVNHIVTLLQNGLDAAASQAVFELLTAVIERHRSDDSRGLPTPYYGFKDCVDWALGRDEIRESFHWRSFALRSLMLMAVKCGLREELDYYWPTLSRISQHEMIPARPQDYFLWHMEEGSQSDRFPDITQSWAALVADASTDYADVLPAVLRRRKHFLPLLINVMPHRFNHRFVLSIFNTAIPASN